MSASPASSGAAGAASTVTTSTARSGGGADGAAATRSSDSNGMRNRAAQGPQAGSNSAPVGRSLVSRVWDIMYTILSRLFHMSLVVTERVTRPARAWLGPWLEPVFEAAKQHTVVIVSFLTGFCALTIASILLALVTYRLVYWYAMPVEVASFPLHFDYKGCNQRPGPCAPIAEVALLKGEQQWMSTALTPTPPPIAELLTAGHGYDVKIKFLLPETQVNRDVGMFMIDLDVLSPTQQLLAHSARPVMLRQSSWLVRIVSTVTWIVPLVLGFSSETQELTIPVFENLMASPDHPVASIRAALSQNVQLYSATLCVEARLYGTRYFMYHWFLASALFFTSLLAMLYCCLGSCGVGLYFLYTQPIGDKFGVTDDDNNIPVVQPADMTMEEAALADFGGFGADAPADLPLPADMVPSTVRDGRNETKGATEARWADVVAAVETEATEDALLPLLTSPAGDDDDSDTKFHESAARVSDSSDAKQDGDDGDDDDDDDDDDARSTNVADAFATAAAAEHDELRRRYTAAVSGNVELASDSDVDEMFF